jgi:tetratricopeptide (TPR) repeat protein
MARIASFFIALVMAGFPAHAQREKDTDFKLTLPDHTGQLRWSADGFRVVQNSAKPNGREVGIRGKDASGRLTFLGFLFLVPEQAPLTSAKCRDGALGVATKRNPLMKITGTSESTPTGGPPIAFVSYTAPSRTNATVYSVRAFVATNDICGDLELYSEKPISAEDADLKKLFASYRFVEEYTPEFDDIFTYAQVLFQAHQYKEAAPLFEAALAKLGATGRSSLPSAKAARRVATDQAGMSYGMSGQIAKARALFEKAVAQDPDYPLYYYNLACADAEEKKLADARRHLQEAFARKANLISGEAMPDPTKDDSFLPYRNDKDFWTFVKGLQDSR